MNTRRHGVRLFAGASFAVLAAACSGGSPAIATEPMTREQLLDPESCRGCHATHYREWASSVHAGASKDPVFLAMNRRGQRETNGELGSFCVKCHAPMAVREGATEDGLNLEEVPEALQGVTCFFCHNAVDVVNDHNNEILLAGDATMRGGIRDPRDPGVHRAAYSRSNDRDRPESSAMCGACHDVVTPNGVHLERTFAEHRASVFATSAPGAGFETCLGCHMHEAPGRVAPASPEGRPLHEHLFAAVDVALHDAPDREAQRAAVECELATSARILSVDDDGFGRYSVRLETSAGHHQPSGAAQDRRLWLEFIAYAADGQVVFESGNIADDAVEEAPRGAPGHDPELVMFRDWTYDANGAPAHQFWDVAPSAEYPEGRRSLVLPAAVESGIPHYLTATYQVPPRAAVARVTARLRMRPIGRDVLADLVDSEDLTSDVGADMPTFTLHGASVEWSPAEPGKLRSLWPQELRCPDAYRSLLDAR
jgi:hypothetical protein